MAPKAPQFDEPVIDGPYHLYEGSFIVEFLQPHPSRNATSVRESTPFPTHC
jgi:hypothetical protein